MSLKRYTLYFSPCGLIQGLFSLWRHLKKKKNPSNTQVSLLLVELAKKDTLLLKAFHAESCFSGSLGSHLPSFGTYCILGHAYFKLGADSKGVLLSTDLVKMLTLVYSFQQWLMTDD